MAEALAIQLLVSHTDPQDREAIDVASRQLLSEVRQFDVESAEFAVGDAAPKGAKGDPVTMGAIAVVLLPVVLPKLIEWLKHWTERDTDRTVRVKAQVGDRSLEVEVPRGPNAQRELEDTLKTVNEALSAMSDQA